MLQGTINGIEIKWKEKARNRLPANAEDVDGDMNTLKAATEHFVFLSAQRLNRKVVIISGSSHDSSTDPATNTTRSDPNHISTYMKPGDYRVHLYLDGRGNGSTAFDQLTVKGESVVKDKTRDQVLSCGTLPPM